MSGLTTTVADKLSDDEIAIMAQVQLDLNRQAEADAKGDIAAETADETAEQIEELFDADAVVTEKLGNLTSADMNVKVSAVALHKQAVSECKGWVAKTQRLLTVLYAGYLSQVWTDDTIAEMTITVKGDVLKVNTFSRWVNLVLTEAYGDVKINGELQTTLVSWMMRVCRSTQKETAEALRLSQSRVSDALKASEGEGDDKGEGEGDDKPAAATRTRGAGRKTKTPIEILMGHLNFVTADRLTELKDKEIIRARDDAKVNFDLLQGAVDAREALRTGQQVLEQAAAHSGVQNNRGGR